jgi:hypothetical protein
MSVGSFADALAYGVIDIYSGPQPALPDNAATGTLLVTLTDASGAYTAETKASGSMTLTAGASGSVNTVTVNGVDVLGVAVPFNTSLTQTAADVAAQINRHPANRLFTASSVGAVVTLTANAALGVLPNTWAVSATLTTLTASYVAFAGGIAAVNGLKFESAVAGALAKRSTQTWSGNAVASGTAGWFRFRESTDTGIGATTTAVRYDGSIATSGAEMTLASLAITLAAPFSVTGATFTLPQQ